MARLDLDSVLSKPNPKGWHWSWQAQPNQNSHLCPLLCGFQSMPELQQHWLTGETCILAISRTTWPIRWKWGSLHPATPGLLFCCMTRSTGVGRQQRASAGVWIPYTCPLSYWRKSQWHLAKSCFQSNAPLPADDWDLGAKKSVSSSTQGKACTVESVTEHVRSVPAGPLRTCVTTTCCKPPPSRTRTSSNQQIRQEMLSLSNSH